MNDSIIRVDFQDEQFLVIAITNENPSEDKVLAGVLQRFDNAVDAIQYAAHVMDGIQIYTREGYFVPTVYEEVAATPEAIAEIADIISFEKEKKILCHVDSCIHNNQAGSCKRGGEFVTIDIHDKQAQCGGYEPKIKRVK